LRTLAVAGALPFGRGRAEVANTVRAGRAWANKAARAAVVGVKGEEGAVTTTICRTWIALAANPRAADRGRVRADVSARAAVVGVRVQPRTSPVADDGAFDAPVEALPIDARAILVGARLVAIVVAGAAVVDIICEIVASISAASLAAVAAGEAPAMSTQAARVVVARPASKETVGPS
jgi:hypothetical protein